MNDPLNIFVSGKMCAGKDTLAAEFISRGYSQVSFARPLKLLCALIIGEDRENLFTGSEVVGSAHADHIFFNLVLDILKIVFPDEAKRCAEAIEIQIRMENYWKAHPEPGKPRRFYQWVGSELFRAYDPNIWILYAGRIVGALNCQRKQVIITDGRFKNEADWARRYGFFLMRIEISPPIQMARYKKLYGRAPTHAELFHPSETDLDGYPFDAVINGAMKIDDFKQDAVAIVGREHATRWINSVTPKKPKSIDITDITGKKDGEHQP